VCGLGGLRVEMVSAVYPRSNPAGRQPIERVADMDALMVIRRILNTFEDGYRLRVGGILTDVHGNSGLAAFVPFASMRCASAVVENAASRRIDSADLAKSCAGVLAGEPARDPWTANSVQFLAFGRLW